jgi:hypothetical protein
VGALGWRSAPGGEGVVGVPVEHAPPPEGCGGLGEGAPFLGGWWDVQAHPPPA